MRFTESQLQGFSALSYDVSPLHTDPEYARRTSFGRPVFFGCAAVLSALGEWAQGRSFRLISFKAEFKKPLFIDEEYSCQLEEAGAQVRIRINKAGGLRMKLVFTWAPFAEDPAAPADNGVFSPLKHARTNLSQKGDLLESVREYRMNVRAMDHSLQSFGLRPGQMPLVQIEALAWASYLVGMEMPGQQALFTTVAFAFDSETAPRFELRHLTSEIHEQFRHVEIEGAARNIPAIALTALIRPFPVNYSIEQLAPIIGASAKLAGKTVLVTGSGRGFGSVLALAFALHGADVVINYAASKQEALAIQHQIDSLGSRAVLAPGDLSTRAGVDAVRELIESEFGGLDIIVNSALPVPPVAGFSEQTPEDVLLFVRRALEISVFTAYGFIPQLRSGGTYITVSTIHVSHLEPNFSAYVTAKSAVEGWTRALALEMPKIEFLIVRPPRMLTDTTNVPQRLGVYASSAAVAARIVGAVSSAAQHGNLRFLEDFEERKEVA